VRLCAGTGGSREWSAWGLGIGDTDGVIRLIATDLDGTLWGPDMVVPPDHVEAIEELARRGITVVAATSRRPRVVRRSLWEAGLALPAVLVDGAIGIDFRTEERFHEAMFDPIDAVATLAGFRVSGLEPCVYVEDSNIDVVVSDAPSTCAAHLASLGNLATVADLDGVMMARSVYAFSVLGLTEERLRPVADLLFGSGMQVTLYAEPTYGGFGLIVNPPGVSKWNGIDAYCRLAGIAADEVLAVGDGDNDVEMLNQAGVGVAVRGGTKRVLEAADHVIDPPSQRGWASLLTLITWREVPPSAPTSPRAGLLSTRSGRASPMGSRVRTRRFE
jgi:hydroxymethylpyrimidine pyrophosphatase-like HAD family hydrolase